MCKRVPDRCCLLLLIASCKNIVEVGIRDAITVDIVVDGIGSRSSTVVIAVERNILL